MPSKSLRRHNSKVGGKGKEVLRKRDEAQHRYNNFL
jgi:hypothetical protein